MNVLFHLLIVMIISISIWKRRFYCPTKCLHLKLDLPVFFYDLTSDSMLQHPLWARGCGCKANTNHYEFFF